MFNSIKIIDSNRKDQSINIINPREIQKDVDNPFRLKVTDPKVKVSFKKEIKKCINLSDLRFTNRIPLNLDEGSLEASIEMAFRDLMRDINIVKKYVEPINCSGKNSDRIKQIMCEYLDSETFDQHIGYFYKSDLRDSYIKYKRDSFRIISMYLVEPKRHKRQKHSKHNLVILFVDPYHLFIPSNDYGTDYYDIVKDYTGNYYVKYFE